MKITMKLFSFILLVALLLSACGPKEAPPEEQAQAPASEEVKVALVLPGVINDNGWCQTAYQGVISGQKETNAEIAYSESVQLPDFDATYRDYANKGYDLVIGHGSEFADVAMKVGSEFPNTYFAVTNADVKGPNIAGLDTKNEEAGYLAGYIAGLLSKTKTVGIISAMEIVAMKRAAEAFPIGVKASCPDCKALVSWVGSFDDVGKGKETALAQIEQGADVIYANGDASSLGMIQAAKEKGVLIVGDTQDQTSLAPDLVITNMMQNLDPMFIEIMKEVDEGKFTPNLVRLNGFDTGIYSITSPNMNVVTQEQADKILAEVERVKNGEVDLPHMSASE